MAVLLLGILITTTVATWATGLLIDVELGFSQTLGGFLNVFPITLAFGSLALALSARLRSRGAVIGISFAVVFLMYLIDIVGKISEDLADLRWISAFRYYGTAMMDGIDWVNVAILLVAALALLGAAVALFERRGLL